MSGAASRLKATTAAAAAKRSPPLQRSASRGGAESGVRCIAEVAWRVNERTENIGARRLHTVLERLLETLSFEAADRTGYSVTIDADYVDKHLGELVKDEDLTRYIL